MEFRTLNPAQVAIEIASSLDLDSGGTTVRFCVLSSTPSRCGPIVLPATMERPQYYENNLTPLSINSDTLLKYLEELRTAVRNGAEIIHAKDPLPEQWGSGGMMKHFHGMISWNM